DEAGAAQVIEREAGVEDEVSVAAVGRVDVGVVDGSGGEGDVDLVTSVVEAQQGVRRQGGDEGRGGGEQNAERVAGSHLGHAVVRRGRLVAGEGGGADDGADV